MRGLQYLAKDAEVPVIICLEGWDSAGKGMVIKKLTEKLDPRMFRVIPGSPPTELEARYHFLWRYQMALPNDGEMVIFDHSSAPAALKEMLTAGWPTWSSVAEALVTSAACRALSIFQW